MLFRNNDLINEMKKLNSKFERQIDRGNVYKFMWLNAMREKKVIKQYFNNFKFFNYFLSGVNYFNFQGKIRL